MVRRPGVFGRVQHFLPEPVDEFIRWAVQSANSCPPEDLQRAVADAGEQHIHEAMLDEYIHHAFPINNAFAVQSFSVRPRVVNQHLSRSGEKGVIASRGHVLMCAHHSHEQDGGDPDQ
jgi:hypothetical protein